MILNTQNVDVVFFSLNIDKIYFVCIEFQISFSIAHSIFNTISARSLQDDMVAPLLSFLFGEIAVVAGNAII